MAQDSAAPMQVQPQRAPFSLLNMDKFQAAHNKWATKREREHLAGGMQKRLCSNVTPDVLDMLQAATALSSTERPLELRDLENQEFWAMVTGDFRPAAAARQSSAGDAAHTGSARTASAAPAARTSTSRSSGQRRAINQVHDGVAQGTGTGQGTAAAITQVPRFMRGAAGHGRR